MDFRASISPVRKNPGDCCVLVHEKASYHAYLVIFAPILDCRSDSRDIFLKKVVNSSQLFGKRREGP